MDYPLGMLGDAEIHFLHYESFEDAKEKWDKRVKRIHYDNMFFKINDRDLCTEEHLLEFDKLGYPNKVSFTTKEYDLVSNVFLKKADNDSNNPRYVDMLCYKKDFDAIAWLNCGGAGGGYRLK